MIQVALATAFMSYFVGSFPTAFVFGKHFLSNDIRTIGTNNMGAYNVFCNIGKIQGFLTLFIDALKGYLPVLLALHLNLSYFWVGACASLALIGHNWSIFTSFKGGKGGSTSAGIFLALFQGDIFILLIIFVGLTILSKNLSFGIGCLIFLTPFLSYLLSKDAWVVAVSSSIALIGLIRILPNIERMLLVSKGNIRTMIVIMLKGFKYYEKTRPQL
jgi:acyl phosphate:glycerol-3-phosphate acyltransferase